MTMENIGPRAPKRQRLVNGFAPATQNHEAALEINGEYANTILLPPYTYPDAQQIETPYPHSAGQFSDSDLVNGIREEPCPDRGTPMLLSPQGEQKLHSLRDAFAHDSGYTATDYPQPTPVHTSFMASHAQPSRDVNPSNSHPQQMSIFVDREVEPQHTMQDFSQNRSQAQPPANNAVGRRVSMPSRRLARAQLACENCRTRKSRCDEGKPTCGYCKESKLECVYQDPQPNKNGKAHKELSDDLAGLQAQMKAMQNVMDDIKTQISRVERNTTPQSITNSAHASSTRSKTAGSRRRSATPVEQPGSSHKSAASEHSTGVHHLFEWPAVLNVLQSENVRNSLDGQEIERHHLQRPAWQKDLLCTARHKPDVYDGINVLPNSKHCEDCGSPDRTPTTPSSLPDSWGVKMAHPQFADGKFTGPSETQYIHREETAKLDTATMRSLLRSYLDNMHIMHPIIDQRSLEALFDHVANRINDSEEAARVEKSAQQSTKKRKFNIDNKKETMRKEDSRLDRSLSTAIVLLVMALGRICQHREFLRGRPGAHSHNNSSSSPHLQAAHSNISPLNSPPLEGGRKSQIPGLLYYSKGVEILAQYQTYFDLAWTQANILASLYAGQLACTLTSWHWLSQACNSCLFLITSKQSALNTGDKPEQKQPLLFAYWTCLQLEGDLLAELDLPPSGHGRLKWGHNDIPHPTYINAAESQYLQQGTDMESIIYHYSGLNTIRYTLDSIQSLLYPPNALSGWRSRSALLQRRNDAYGSLTSWRSYVNKHLNWDDKDPPATNINDARLRAKYWGALYVINRPVLYYALHHLSEYDVSDWGTATKTSPPKHEELWRICRQCLQAAKRSTMAFDRLIFRNNKATNRLIVTNIFGTAHAQFGNMLVLAATYMSHLRPLVKKDKLVSLLLRTIDFLSELAPLSTTLQTDARVLQGVLGALDSHQPYTTSPVSSFEWPVTGSFDA